MKKGILETWIDKVKHSLFKYKDGFYELPVFANTPETIIKGITKMPFVYHKPKQQIFGTNNPFIKSNVFYNKVEEGLWFVYSISDYKRNVNFINQVDPSLEGRYFVIFIEINENRLNEKKSLLNGLIFTQCNWVISKPLVNATNCRFKGNKITSAAFFISEDWIKTNLETGGILENSDLNFLFGTKDDLLIRNEDIDIIREYFYRFNKLFFNQLNGNVGSLKWQEPISQFFGLFVNRVKSTPFSSQLHALSDADRKRLQKIENTLLENVHSGFPGVELLAQQVGISKNKLMSIFKKVYNKSMFHYFRYLQLKSAREILLNSDLLIGEIAQTFGYNNATKFSNAFKEEFGILPSDLKAKQES